MKKLMMTLAAVLCCTALFNSCNKTNSQKQEEEKPDTTPVFVQATFTYYGTDDMFEIADITGIFNDGTGEKSEPVNTVNWTKTVTATLPATLSFGRTVKLKEGIELSNDRGYTYTRNFNIDYVPLNAKGEEIKNMWGNRNSIISPNTLNGKQLAVILESHRLDVTHTFKFDKDGVLLINSGDEE